MDRKPNPILYHERKRRGWTQSRLAQEINNLDEAGDLHGAATADMLRKWEKGIHIPSAFYLDRLCRLFECTADQLGFALAGGVQTSLAPSPALSLPFSETPSSAMWLMRMITMIDRWPPSSLKDLQVMLTQELAMKHADEQMISRREAVLALAALPVALFIGSRTGPPVEELLARYAASLTACWNLYFEGCVNEIKAYLPLYLSQLAAIAKTPSKYQKAAASLTAQAYQLDWWISLQDQDFGRALLATKEAAIYGEIANDPNILLSSRIRRANVFFHLKNPVQQWRYHEGALQYIQEVTPLLRSWAYMVVGENHAALHHHKDADRFIGLARDTFPDHPEEDPNSSYIPVNQYTLSKYEFFTFLRMEQPEKALQSLERIEKDIPNGFVPRRAELTNHHLMALCALGNLDAACEVFELAERAARQSKLRYNEVCEIYSQMCTRWPHEKRVLELEDLLRREE
ncbi:MAG: hypothetical protein WCD86_04400 [Ktedonobacteraceae bacterium]